MIDLRRAADAVADAAAAILPVPCVGCGREGRAVCGACRPYLEPRVSRADVAGLGPRWSALEYAGVPRAALLALKESGHTSVASALAPAFAAAVSAAVDASGPPLRAVPVPATRAARRRRGSDPLRLLVARAGVPTVAVFAPARPHAAQKSLGLADRTANLAGVFALARPVAGHRFVLLDDVATTGATLAAAAAVLRAGGAEVVGAATLAATPRYSANSSELLSRSTRDNGRGQD